jgi:hypothetical protein
MVSHKGVQIVVITTLVFMEIDGNNVHKQFWCQCYLMGIRVRFQNVVE